MNVNLKLSKRPLGSAAHSPLNRLGRFLQEVIDECPIEMGLELKSLRFAPGVGSATRPLFPRGIATLLSEALTGPNSAFMASLSARSMQTSFGPLVEPLIEEIMKRSKPVLFEPIEYIIQPEPAASPAFRSVVRMFAVSKSRFKQLRQPMLSNLQFETPVENKRVRIVESGDVDIEGCWHIADPTCFFHGCADAAKKWFNLVSQRRIAQIDGNQESLCAV